MTRLLTVTREGELSRVLPHQVLKSLQRHNLPERHMNRLRPGFHAENFRGLVRQMGIQPYRRQRRSHAFHLNVHIYSLAESYVRVKALPGQIYDTTPGPWLGVDWREPLAASGTLCYRELLEQRLFTLEFTHHESKPYRSATAGADRPGAPATAHCGDHGRQRSVGQAPSPATDCGASRRHSRRPSSGGGVCPPRRSLPHPLCLLGGKLEATRHGSETVDEPAARVPAEGNHRTEPAEYPVGGDWPHPRVVKAGAKGPHPGYPEDERQHRAAPDAGAQLRRAR